MSSGVKTSLALQRAQPKVIKPGNFSLSSTWNPNVPKSRIQTNDNASNIEEDDEIRLRLRSEDIFDEIMDKMLDVPIEQALEGPLQRLFNCSMCIFWIDMPNDMTLYSPSRKISVGLSNSIVGYTRLARSVIQIQNQNQCPPNFIIDSSIGIQENSKHIFFPVASSGIIYGVIQIIRNPDMPFFSDDDLDFVTFVMNKFSLIGNCIFNTSHLCDISLQFFQKTKQPALHVLDILEKYFQCKSAELWKYELNSDSYFFFDRQTNEFTEIETNEFGIVGQSLTKSCIVNDKTPSDLPFYSEPFDGIVEGPILVVPYEKTSREIWCLALRGRSRPFNVYDEREVMSIMPFIVRGALNSSASDEDIAAFLKSLLDSSSKMICCLNLIELFNLAQKLCLQLIDCEKAVFLVTDKKNEFFMRGCDFVNQENLPQSRKIPIGKGLAGICYKEKRILNVSNPKSDSNFCNEVDCLVSDVELLNAMFVPLLNLHDESVGVLILYNKSAADKFSERDESTVIAFNVFAGIAFDNAKQYKASYDLSTSMIKFAKDFFSEKNQHQKETVKTELSKLMEKLLEVTFCSRITLFVRKDIDEFSSFINVGCESFYGSLFANEAAKKGSPLFVDSNRLDSKSSISKQKQELKDRSSVHMNNRPATTLVSSLLDQRKPRTYSKSGNDPNEVIYDVPIIDDHFSIVGVLEFHFFNGRSDCEIELFNSFASLCAKLPLAESDFEALELINNDELNSHKVPQKLQLEISKSSPLFELRFDVQNYDEIELIMIVFSVFSRFGLMDEFDIGNSQLFSFLKKARVKFVSNSPFCTFRLAVDTLQFTSFAISAGKLEAALGKEGILSVLVASLCHGVGEDVFDSSNGTFSMWQEALLSRFCGCSEINHSIEFISIESTLFSNVKPPQSKVLLDQIIELILSTDMSLHFTILNDFLSAIKNGNFDTEENPRNRLLLMKIIIKCADLASLARPFEVARRSFSFLPEKFYRRGDIERAEGIVFASPNVEREEISKDESFVGFVKSVALPLFEALTKQADQLSSVVNQIKKNITLYEKEMRGKK